MHLVDPPNFPYKVPLIKYQNILFFARLQRIFSENAGFLIKPGFFLSPSLPLSSSAGIPEKGFRV